MFEIVLQDNYYPGLISDCWDGTMCKQHPIIGDMAFQYQFADEMKCLRCEGFFGDFLVIGSHRQDICLFVVGCV